MIKQENITRRKFNSLKPYYDKTWDASQQTLHVGIFDSKDNLDQSYKNATDYLINRVEKILPITSNSKILDIGCGTGKTIINICKKYNCSGIGLDLSDEQIKSAKKYLQNLNKDRLVKNLPKINCRFIRASASELSKVFKDDEIFSHVISQDALFLVIDKKSCYENIYRLLMPGGAIGIADFLSYTDKVNFAKKQKATIYKFVNWNKGLSFDTYKSILQAIGLNLKLSEEHNQDMIKTYSLLSQKIKKYINRDKVYIDLYKRYLDIVKATKKGDMGWGLFFAVKPRKKQIILTGTKEKSISRHIAKTFHKNGWEVWLYSRQAKRIDYPYWHERRCDITNEAEVKHFFQEVNNIDLAIQLADTNGGHDSLEDLEESEIKNKIDAKLTGSAIISKQLIQKSIIQNQSIKLVWCAGKVSQKPKNLILYSLINSGLKAFIEELNTHYSKHIQAYYLPTTLIMPSTLGDAYIKKFGIANKKIAKHPDTIINKIHQILDGLFKPGMIGNAENLL